MGHLQENGFTVQTREVTDAQLVAIKAEHGVPRDLESCHTAIAEGYVVEGHVPADVLARFLEDKPDVRGLTVPGMPIGSPGMEGPNPQPYNVLTFNEGGSRAVYERR
ncbi:MAG: DUF411 domain-containing protein [Gemmatimonadales bacterium]